VPFGVRVRIAIGDPISRDADEDPLAILREARLQIGKNLDRWSS
jgi:hypothetical protein